jgi:hypothetical protein
MPAGRARGPGRGWLPPIRFDVELADQSSSGNPAIRPGRGGHSIAKVLPTIRAEPGVSSSALSRTTSPPLGRTGDT